MLPKSWTRRHRRVRVLTGREAGLESDNEEGRVVLPAPFTWMLMRAAAPSRAVPASKSPPARYTEAYGWFRRWVLSCCSGRGATNLTQDTAHPCAQ